MTRLRRTTAAGWAALLLATAATGCSDDGPPDATEATPQSIGAALASHYDESVLAVAPLSRDQEGVRRDDLAVAVTFDREGSDNTHVQVVVTEGPPFGEEDAASLCEGVYACEERDGATLVLEMGAPEEDPRRLAPVVRGGERHARAGGLARLVRLSH